MKYSPRWLKQGALHALKGNWWNIISCYFAYDLIGTIIVMLITSRSGVTFPYQSTNIMDYIMPAGFIILASMTLSVILSPFRVGFMRCLLDIIRLKPLRILDVFSKPENWPKIMLASLIKLIFIILVSIIPVYMIITGIVTGVASVILSFALMIINIEFAFVDFLLADNDNISAFGAIKCSLRMIKGHRWHYLNLIVSFLLWFLLVYITGGLVSFLLEIYILAASANLYNTILEDNRLNTTV